MRYNLCWLDFTWNFVEEKFPMKPYPAIFWLANRHKLPFFYLKCISMDSLHVGEAFFCLKTSSFILFIEHKFKRIELKLTISNLIGIIH